jgi:hypothetical protein
VTVLIILLALLIRIFSPYKEPYSITSTTNEPDIQFNEAIKNFDIGLVNESVANINNGAAYVRSLIFKEDTTNKAILEQANQILKNLSNSLKSKNINDVEQLKDAFMEVDDLILEYHYSIIEDFYLNEGEGNGDFDMLYHVLQAFHDSLGYEETLSDESVGITKFQKDIISEYNLTPELELKVHHLMRSVNINKNAMIN